MLAIERKNQILVKLQEEGKVVVGELSKLFDVSEETIRRDLDKLDKEGLCIKSYGGAVFNENSSIDMPFNVRSQQNIVGKQRIASLVAELIHDGDHIILDASTTALFIAKAIRDKKNITVITNSLEIMIELADAEGWNVISPGGSLREGYLALVGPKCVEGLMAYNVEKSIVSCKGIDMQKGVTEGNEQFSQIKQVMQSVSKERIIAVDHSKFDVVAFSKVCDFSETDIIVTDEKPDENWLTYLAGQGVRCIYP